MWSSRYIKRLASSAIALLFIFGSPLASADSHSGISNSRASEKGHELHSLSLYRLESEAAEELIETEDTEDKESSRLSKKKKSQLSLNATLRKALHYQKRQAFTLYSKKPHQPKPFLTQRQLRHRAPPRSITKI